MVEDEREDSELDALLRALDHRPARVTAQDVIARARRSRGTPVRVTAAFAAAVTVAGVAYALPGSPVRGWVHAALDLNGAPVDPPAAGPGAARDAGPGIAFDPAEPLTITIAAGSSGQLRIVIAEGGDVVVRMLSGEARFTSDPNALRVELHTPDTLEVRIPGSASSLTVRHGTLPVFTRQGRDISTSMARDSAGRYVLGLNAGSS